MKSPTRRVATNSISQSISAPVSRTRRQTQRGPQFARSDKLTVTNSVLLTTVIADGSLTNFSSEKFVIQPGDPTVFPWLNKIAQNFEYYKVKKMSARYENACSTTTSGQVLLYWDYDVTDPVPLTFAQASVMSGNKLSAPWDRFVLPASVSAIHQQEPSYYVATSATNNRLNDSCSLMVCTIPSLGSAPLAWGNIWIDFSFEFSLPAFETSLPEAPNLALTIYEQPSQELTVGLTDGALITDPVQPVTPILDGLSLGPISSQTSLSVGGMVMVPSGRYRVSTTPNIRGTAGSAGTSQLIDAATSFAISDTDNIVAAVTTAASTTSQVEPTKVAGSYQWMADAFERVIDLPIAKYLAPIMDYTVQDIVDVVIEEATSFAIEYLGPSLLLSSSKTKDEAERKFYSKYLHTTLYRHERLRRSLHPETMKKLFSVSDAKSSQRLLALERYVPAPARSISSSVPQETDHRISAASRSSPLPSSSSLHPPTLHRDSQEPWTVIRQ